MLKGHNNEIVTMLDETLGIWQNEFGYYWVDQFDRTWSNVYFKSEQDALTDCIDLVYGG